MTTVDPRLDLYRLLEVDPAATTAQIARAYRRLARRWHPDVAASPGAAEHFAQITVAYRVLSDPASRARYDATRPTKPTPPSRPTRATGGTWRPPWTGRSTRPDPAAFWLGGPSFAHASTLNPEPTGQHTDSGIDAEVEISLEEAYRGTRRTLTVTGPHGTVTMPVTIPPGVLTGQRLHVPVNHLPGGHDGQPVVLQVRLTEDTRYRVEGRNVHVDLPLAPWEAALGGTVTLQAPAGQLQLQIPAGTSSGTVLAISAGGLPNPDGPAGDLHAHVAIAVPSPLSPAERRLFTQLAHTSTFRPRMEQEPQP